MGERENEKETDNGKVKKKRQRKLDRKTSQNVCRSTAETLVEKYLAGNVLFHSFSGIWWITHIVCLLKMKRVWLQTAFQKAMSRSLSDTFGAPLYLPSHTKTNTLMVSVHDCAC